MFESLLGKLINKTISKNVFMYYINMMTICIDNFLSLCNKAVLLYGGGVLAYIYMYIYMIKYI